MEAYWWIFLFLAALQGFTEVFPISSTGHLAVFKSLLDPPSFNLAMAAGLHGGSLIAITAFFRREIYTLWNHFRASWGELSQWARGGKNPFIRASEQHIPYLIMISLIPVAIEGLLLQPRARKIFENPTLVLILLMVNGMVILATALITHGERTMKELSWKEYLAIGLVQGIAVLPGISRLGLVLCTGLWLRLKWQQAIRLAFILAIPVLLGGLMVEGDEVLLVIAGDFRLTIILLFGIVLAAVCSWLGLKMFTSRLLERRTLAIFGLYCLMLGIFTLVYLSFWNLTH